MKQLLELIPIALFFIAYKAFDIYVATAVLMITTITQVTVMWFIHRKVESIQWIMLGLVVVMGTATLYLQNEQFIKWKFSIVEWFFGIAFFASQFIGKSTLVEKMMSASIDLPKRVWKWLNVSWSLFFIAIGFLNVYVMFHYETDAWMNFKTFVVPALMAVFIVVQIAILYKYVPDPEQGNKDIEAIKATKATNTVKKPHKKKTK